jgi:putative nucleotidyltransferase with HDIG domain
MITLQEIMKSVGELTPLPPTAPRLAQVISDANSTVDDVASVLQYDQALTLDILKYANSAISASSRTIATVKDAVVRLGGARVLERVVAHHVKGVMQEPLSSYGYSEKDLWRHSVAAAVAAEQLGTLTKSKSAGLSFTAALLHDIGKLILCRCAPEQDMRGIFRLVFDDPLKLTCEQAEKRALGFSHADVGAEVASSWQLPTDIVEAVRNHHSPGAAGEPVTDAVRVANIVARTIGEGIGNEGMSLAVDSGLAQRVGLSRDQFETVCAHSCRRLETVLSMFDRR